MPLLHVNARVVFFDMCAPWDNMLTLQESVPMSSGISSSDVLGEYFDFMLSDMCQACE